jgi:MerR family transcriptional regulator, thiopeptide resistance regulator
MRPPGVGHKLRAKYEQVYTHLPSSRLTVTRCRAEPECGRYSGLDHDVTSGSRVRGMNENTGLSVGAVARLAGTTVRTMHHYDQIGLLRPSGRTRAGYRTYGEGDVERLQQILFYRELGFSLEAIAGVMSNGTTEPLDHLRRQHELLGNEIERLQRMVQAVQKAIEASQMGIKLTPEERLEVFGGFDPAAYEAEAGERWGKTDAYAESARKTAAYTKADWLRVQAESKAVNDRFVAAMTAGLDADSLEAMDAAEAHRKQIGAFYACSPDMHVGLAEMYINDPRFAANYEKVAPGLAQYVHDAILANAARAKAG